MSEPAATGAIALSLLDLAVATALILVAGTVSVVMKLGLERRLLIASIRTVTQLLLIGYVLRWVFALEDRFVIGLLVLLMTVAAGHAAVRRPSRTFRGVLWRSCILLFLTGVLTVFVVTSVIIGADPWWKPQYLIPLLGMILGNSLSGISLTLDYLLEALSTRRAEVESDLALGATRWEAARRPIAEAVRRGMIPMINSMMVVGIVSLPGMMTGQILQGADPLVAVKYQIVVMFMLAAATSLGAIGIAVATFFRVFTPHHQLRTDIITRRS
jgi:putative ABC transport system permease protein